MGETTKKSRKSTPARTPEARENQLISLAVDLVEKKLRDGTASSQILSQLLALATTKAKLELEKMLSDLRVSEAKIQQMESQARSTEIYEEAIKAFREYNGDIYEGDDDEY